MKANVGGIDKGLRIVAGLGILSLLGLNTCALQKKHA